MEEKFRSKSFVKDDVDADKDKDKGKGKGKGKGILQNEMLKDESIMDKSTNKGPI